MKKYLIGAAILCLALYIQYFRVVVSQAQSQSPQLSEEAKKAIADKAHEREDTRAKGMEANKLTPQQALEYACRKTGNCALDGQKQPDKTPKLEFSTGPVAGSSVPECSKAKKGQACFKSQPKSHSHTLALGGRMGIACNDSGEIVGAVKQSKNAPVWEVHTYPLTTDLLIGNYDSYTTALAAAKKQAEVQCGTIRAIALQNAVPSSSNLSNTTGYAGVMFQGKPVREIKCDALKCSINDDGVLIIAPNHDAVLGSILGRESKLVYNKMDAVPNWDGPLFDQIEQLWVNQVNEVHTIRNLQEVTQIHQDRLKELSARQELMERPSDEWTDCITPDGYIAAFHERNKDCTKVGAGWSNPIYPTSATITIEPSKKK